MKGSKKKAYDHSGPNGFYCQSFLGQAKGHKNYTKICTLVVKLITNREPSPKAHGSTTLKYEPKEIYRTDGGLRSNSNVTHFRIFHVWEKEV